LATSKNQILVVSDEADTRMFLTNLLLAVKLHPIGAGSRDEGLTLARKKRPRAIILDVMMADRDGIRLFRGLRTDPLLREIPVIMLSAIDKATLFGCEKYQPREVPPALPNRRATCKSHRRPTSCSTSSTGCSADAQDRCRPPSAAANGRPARASRPNRANKRQEGT